MTSPSTTTPRAPSAQGAATAASCARCRSLAVVAAWLAIVSAASWGVFAVAGGRHGIRAALIDVEEVGSLYWPRAVDRADIPCRIDGPANLAPLKERLDAAGIAAPEKPTIESARALGEAIYLLGAEERAKRPHAPPATFRNESPVDIFDHLAAGGGRLTCYPTSILFCSAAQALGWRTRVVNLDGPDQMGGSGHTVAEVWLPNERRWMLVDAFYGLSWSDAETEEPLSVAQLRKALVSSPLGLAEPAPPGEEGAAGSDRPWWIAKPRLDFFPQASRHKSVEERTADYADALANVCWFANNAFMARHAERLAGMGYAGTVIDMLPRQPKRAIARLLSPMSTRYHATDAAAPPYRSTLWRRWFWTNAAISGLLVGVATAAAIGAWRRRRARGRGKLLAADAA